MKLYKCIFFTLFVFLLSKTADAQKINIFRVSGKSGYVKQEKNETPEKTKQKAITLAKINALIGKFGEYVEKTTKMSVESGRIDFRTYGGVKVRGEWIKTIGEPEIRKVHKDAESGIYCTIKGEAKAAAPKANLNLEILNCSEKNCNINEFHEFNSGARMYFSFKSPIDGYLSIYLDDGNDVFRLLPYRKMTSKNSVKIEGDKEYIFFSEKQEHNYFDTPIDKISLITSKNIEINTLYVIFSEEEYYKPILKAEERDNKGIIPKSLSRLDFHNWLSNNRATINDFLDIEKHVKIVNKN